MIRAVLVLAVALLAGWYCWRRLPDVECRIYEICESDQGVWVTPYGDEVSARGGEWSDKPIPLPTEPQQARGSSGGAANQGAGT